MKSSVQSSLSLVTDNDGTSPTTRVTDIEAAQSSPPSAMNIENDTTKKNASKLKNARLLSSNHSDHNNRTVLHLQNVRNHRAQNLVALGFKYNEVNQFVLKVSVIPKILAYISKRHINYPTLKNMIS